MRFGDIYEKVRVGRSRGVCAVWSRRFSDVRVRICVHPTQTQKATDKKLMYVAMNICYRCRL